MKYYDRANNRLICVSKKADEGFWDDVWLEKITRDSIKNSGRDYLVAPETRKYLPLGSRILEGGCGTGKFVYQLSKLGYTTFGIDTASKTVKKVRALFPGLSIAVGDVRKAPFRNGSFDGYWSLGVIEHFFEGYLPIVREIRRLLRPGGYLFLTFPYLSPLRKFKIMLNMYSVFSGKKPSGFYQFVLSSDEVISVFFKNGFKLVKKRPFDGYSGLGRELGFQPKFAKLFFSILALPFAAHSILLVFRKV